MKSTLTPQFLNILLWPPILAGACRRLGGLASEGSLKGTGRAQVMYILREVIVRVVSFSGWARLSPGLHSRPGRPRCNKTSDL